MEITLYLVGSDADNAQENFPFDSYESAQSYADDGEEDHLMVFTVSATIDFSTIEPA